MTSPLATAGEELKLRDGLLIDPANGQAIFMRPEGGMASVRVNDGTTAWVSADADRPMELNDGVLLSQVDTAREGAMDLARIDTATGELTSRETLPLPAMVIPVIDQRLGQSFEIRSLNESLTAWQYQRKVVSGMPRNDSGVIAAESGSFVVGSNLVEAASVPSTAQLAAAWRAPNVVVDVIPGVIGRQFQSNDGQHVLVSRQDGDLARWDRYLWEIYDASGQKVSETRSFMSYSPFVVSGGHVLFVTQPYTLTGESGDVERSPLMLRAINLSTGTESWSREIRDTRYRGPYPA